MKHPILTSCLLACSLAASALTITRDGASDYVIAVPDKAPAVIMTAAKELQDNLKTVTGAELPIVLDMKRAGKPAFVIGINKPGFDFTQAKPDTIGIRTEGNDILLNGRLPRGPLYAVYTFLEDTVGINWWSPEDTDYPNLPTLTINPVNLVYSPVICSRETFYRGAQTFPFSPKLKNNGNFTRLPAEFGGGMRIIGWCHTFYQFLPPKDYFQKHPEWYSLVDGKRQAERHQLCLTNPEMTAEFIRVVLEKCRKDPSAGIISVSQNDWHGRCECPKCKAIEEAEGSPSGLLIRFVNTVAAAVKKEFPDFLVETLAYQYTRKAPKITKPADNVVVRLCSIEMNFAQPLESGPDNASFKKDIEDWSAIAPNLYIWNYITNFRNYLIPHPNWRALGKDIRFFVKHHAIGIFEQGDSGSNLGDFVRARQWLIAHLLWNPELDQRALMEKFFNGYYGAAGPYLLDYIDFLCDSVEKTGFNLRCYVQDTNGWLPERTALPKAVALYKKAEDAVRDNPTLAQRVRRERLSLDLACLLATPKLARWKNFTHEDVYAFMPAEPLELAKEYEELTARWKVGNVSEGRAFGHYAQDIRENIEMSLTPNKLIPEWCKGKSPESWDHFTSSRFEYHRKGEWVTIVEDPKATTGKAARMPSRWNQWATQIPVGDYYGIDKKWKFRFAVRCDGVKSDDLAMWLGVYSTVTKQNLVKYELTARQLAGPDYVVIETPFLKLTKDQYVWFAPVVQPADKVSAVYVDYVSMIRED